MVDQEDQLPEDEIARRMERGIRRFLKTPPQPHGKNPKELPPLKPRRSPSRRRRREGQKEV